MTLIPIADLVVYPDGRTMRQVNAAKVHAIPIGALVEMENGARLFVVHYARDCDQTPLYSLSADPEDTVLAEPRFYNRGWTNGWDEASLKVVTP